MKALEFKERWPTWWLMLHGEAQGRSRWDMVKWWEARRIRYNLILLSIGIASMISVLIAGSYAVKPSVDFEEPLGFIVLPPIYALMANLCYSLGPVFDWFRNNGEPSRRLFQVGLYFSMLMTAAPGLWAISCAIRAFLTGQKIG